MGAGDQYMNRRFSVPMGGAAQSWPFREAQPTAGVQCPACGATPVPPGPHDDARDAGRPRVRACFERTRVTT